MGYAQKVLNKMGYDQIKIRAAGNAIVKAMILVELIKRRQGNFHQINRIFSMEKTTYEEPQIEGMDKIPVIRRVTALDIILSRTPLDETDPGYQQPEPKEERPP